MPVATFSASVIGTHILKYMKKIASQYLVVLAVLTLVILGMQVTIKRALYLIKRSKGSFVIDIRSSGF